MNPWEIQYLPEAQQDLEGLDRSVIPEVLKGIRKVAQNPGYPDGYGKPLGNVSGTDLFGLYKIKFRKSGLRVVYGLKQQDQIMIVIIISVRADDAVYREAGKRRQIHNL